MSIVEIVEPNKRNFNYSQEDGNYKKKIIYIIEFMASHTHLQIRQMQTYKRYKEIYDINLSKGIMRITHDLHIL